MVSLSDLARQYTDLGPDERTHLRRLVASWGLIADLSFADLLLFGVAEGDDERFVILGQIRPTTAQTLYRDDLVGRFIAGEHRPLVVKAAATGETVDAEIDLPLAGRRASVQAVPVVFDGRIIAVMTVETPRLGARMPGDLEHAYLNVFNTFVGMIRTGAFPFAYEDAETEESPRVGDGVIVLDARSRIEFTSPNAVSALHRLGFHANTHGRELEDVGFHADAVRTAFRLRVPVTEEIERGPSVSMLARLLPLVADDAVVGAIVLIRDVSELRRHERLLVSMDATIREIHHRVKNNLQTVSSLLRLQGRRVESPEAKAAIEESVRRIRSIALVHEILARSGGDAVSFGEVVRPIVSMVEQALVAPDRPISFSVVGDGPTIPASTASSLAVILTELLQNAVAHGYPPGSSGGRVVVELETDTDQLVVRVHDDGVGLADDFDLEEQSGLGLTIVRTLAAGELNGTVSLRAAAGGEGTVAQFQVSLQEQG